MSFVLFQRKKKGITLIIPLDPTHKGAYVKQNNGNTIWLKHPVDNHQIPRKCLY